MRAALRKTQAGVIARPMKILTTFSVNGKRIRLRKERWRHVWEEHPEMRVHQSHVTYTISNPQAVHKQQDGTYIAYQWNIRLGAYTVVVYREFNTDGDVITAYDTNNPLAVVRGCEKIWPRQ